MGSEPLHFQEVLGQTAQNDSVEAAIFFKIRLPRVWIGLLAGGALGVAGAALQVMFRNPLAEPWTLGMAGGAGLGAFIARAVFPAALASVGPFHFSQALALAGVALVWAYMAVLSKKYGGVNVQVLLLAGVTIGIICGGMILVWSLFVMPHRLLEYQRWIMGSLAGVTWLDVWRMLSISIPGTLILLCCARQYNPLGLSEDAAAGYGVDVSTVWKWTAVGAGLASAGVVAIVGPIGFIGLLAPHAARRWVGPDMRWNLPCSFLLGGVLLAGCDAAGRWLAAPVEIPVGAVLAVIGGPLFLWCLTRGISSHT